MGLADVQTAINYYDLPREEDDSLRGSSSTPGQVPVLLCLVRNKSTPCTRVTASDLSNAPRDTHCAAVDVAQWV